MVSNLWLRTDTVLKAFEAISFLNTQQYSFVRNISIELQISVFLAHLLVLQFFDVMSSSTVEES